MTDGASTLWHDALRRLLRNRAAVAGGVVVLFMAVAALGFDLLSAHFTRFRFDEQHLSAEPKPIGARSIPQTYYALDETQRPLFAEIDTDGDGQISRHELSVRMQAGEFATLDLDRSGGLDAAELSAAPLNLLQGSGPATLASLDADRDGTLDQDEAAPLTDIMPEDEARDFIKDFDKGSNNDLHDGGDQQLSQAEFPGLPLPEVHHFGTDELGRDLLTRVLQGARVSLTVGLVATAVSFWIGVLWGATAGFLGGRIDELMMRIVDVLYGLPFMFLVILLMALFQDVPADRKLWLLFVALGAVQWLTMSRIVRGQVLSLKRREFVEAARAIGVSKARILLRHLVPNALGPIVVYATLTVPAVMLEEAFLSFIGLGVQAPYASWGSLAAEGAKAFREYPWMIAFPGAALALTLLSLNFLGDGLRDALDPQSGGPGAEGRS